MAPQAPWPGLGAKSIDPRARLIAEEFRADFPRSLDALQRLVTGLPSIQSRTETWPESAGFDYVDYADNFLRAAYRALGWQKALKLVSETPLDVLERRVLVTRYLAGCDEFDGLPLFSRQELAEQLRLLRELLRADRQHLLQTGLPSKYFHNIHWLWKTAAKLYVTKWFEADAPHQRPLGDELSHYAWVRIFQSPKDFSVTVVPCREEDADLLPGIDAGDATRLRSLREAILDLKIEVLGAAESFLASSCTGDFLSQCLPLFRKALTVDAAQFCMRMDRAYKEIPNTLRSTIRVAWLDTLPCDWMRNPGGFSSIVQLIGHVEKEKTIGTMHSTRETLGELVGVSGGRRALSAKNEWAYFDFVQRGAVEIVNRAIEIFREGENRDGAFWAEFHGRVSSSITAELDQEIGVRLRVKPGIADEFQLNVQTYAEWLKSLLAMGASLPTLQIASFEAQGSQGGDEPSRSAEQNVFRRAGRGWMIRFRGGNVLPFRNLDGLQYLSILIEQPGQGFLAAQLYAAKGRYSGSSRSRSARSTSEMLDEHTGDEADKQRSRTGPNVVSNAGTVIDSLARDSYERRLGEIDEELAVANDLNNEAKISNLQEERKALIDELRAAIGIGGQLVQQSSENKKLQDKVRNAIDRAVEAIKEENEILALHFGNALESVPLFKYSPDEAIVWNHSN